MKIFCSFLIVAVAMSGAAVSAQDDTTQTFVIARTGVRDDTKRVYHLFEVFQQRGKWILPDVGYIDFGHTGEYRELFFGGGAVLFSSKNIAIIEEAYISPATGPASGGAVYLQLYTQVVFNFTPKFGGEVAYFPYLPLNEAGRIQHVLERVKAEYDFGSLKAGGGYGAYKFGDDAWQNKPFITATLKGGRLGNLELWLQRMPGNYVQLQLRFEKLFD